jgi:hypothetical protein
MDFSNFYTLVLTIAVVILIIVLAYLGWVMSKAKNSDEFPKLRTSCPDLWTVENGPDGKVFCVKPTAKSALNKGDGNNMEDAPGANINKTKFDTNDVGWASAGNAVCGKQKWANSHGIQWDTVSNANFCN